MLAQAPLILPPLLPLPLSSVYLIAILSLISSWVGIFQPLVFRDISNNGYEWQWNILICYYRLLCSMGKDLSVTSRIFPSFVTLSKCLIVIVSSHFLHQSIWKLTFLGISHVFNLLLLWDFPVSFPHPWSLCLHCSYPSNCLRSVLLSQEKPEQPILSPVISSLSLFLTSLVSLGHLKWRKSTVISRL